MASIPANKHQKKESTKKNNPAAILHVDLHFLLHKTKFNPHLMVEMISLYLEQTPPLIESMKISLTNKDWDLLQASAHKMIPSFLIMGIHSDYKIITEQIQQQAKNHHFELLPDLILTLETKCNQACQELEKELIWFKKECL